MTTTTSATGPAISSAGIGSGLDVKGIIGSLMSVESQPLTLLQNKESTINTEISAVGQITSLASAMADKARALSSAGLWTQTTSSSSDASAVTGDTGSGKAAAGDYLVSVQQLALGQTVTSGTFADAKAALGEGSLTIQLGTYGSDGRTPPGPTFTNQPDSTAVKIPITGDTSLGAIRDKINAANAGVQASIITDANGARLSLRSTTTGAANGFKITATAAPSLDPSTGAPTQSAAGSGLEALNFDPVGGSAQLSLNQWAMNAKATVNGVAVESATNKLENISDGLSLTLMKKTETPIDVTVSADTESMQKAITDFVSAYSALQSYISLQTKYDGGTAPAAGTSRKDGPLQGDPSIVGFQNQLRAIVTTASTTSALFSRLSDIGITVQADGTLANSSTTKLTAALAHPDELAKLFTTQGTTNEDTGIAVRFAKLGDRATGVDGSLFSRSAGLRGELSRNQKQQDDMQQHLDQTQARLTAQYQALDTQMSKMNALSSYVSQQVAQMDKK